MTAPAGVPTESALTSGHAPERAAGELSKRREGD
jgi:hypothetical protein